MHIRLTPKQLWRRLEFARIKARSHYEREAVLSDARHRQWERDFEERRRQDEEAKATLSRAEHLQYLLHRPMEWPILSFATFGNTAWKALCRIEKLEGICKQAVEWVELDHEEWDLIETWRKQPFAVHPSNAEAFPKIAAGRQAGA